MTLSAWINIPEIPSAQALWIVNKFDGNAACGGGEYTLSVLTNGQVEFSMLRYGGALFPAIGGSISTNHWHHVVGVYKRDSFIRLYVDGVQAGETGTANFTANVTASRLVIGHGGLFKGLIDEVALFRRALSPSEIQGLYKASSSGMYLPPLPTPTGLVGWWPGEGTANDLAGTNHGTLSNGVTFSSGQVAQAFSLDGVNDVVVIPDSPVLSPHVGAGGEISVAAWVKIDRYPDPDPVTGVPARAVVAKAIPGSFEYEIAVLTNGNFIFVAWNISGGTYSTTSPGTSESRLSLHEWHHLAVSMRKGSFLRAYLDGVLVGESFAFKGNTSDGPSPLFIGGFGDGQSFDGSIDEVKLFSRALSAAEIEDLYAADRWAAPTITLQPVGGAYVPGGNATLSVTAVGDQPLSFRWFFNGTNAVADATNATLTLNNLQTSQTGLYSVMVSNGFGSQISLGALLTVRQSVPPPSGLVAWWRGENNGVDSIGRFHAGLEGTPAYWRGKVGEAFQFNAFPRTNRGPL